MYNALLVSRKWVYLMSGSQSYKISIEGFGLSLEREVPQDIGEKVVVLLLTGQSTEVTSRQDNKNSNSEASNPFQEESKANPSQDSNISVREYLDNNNAKRVPDKVTTIGDYLRIHSNQADFDRSDLVTQLENAAERVPRNLARDIKWAMKAGWIAPRNGMQDRYYVTNSGQNAVSEKFSKEVVQKTRGMASGGKKQAKKDGVDEQIN